MTQFSKLLHKRLFMLPEEIRDAHKVSEALECMRRRWPEAMQPPEEDEAPIFILSPGWRTGSTLLQRLLVSSGEVAIWGEPLGEAGIIPRLAHTLTAVNQEWPYDEFFDETPDLSHLSFKWIANLSPPMGALRSAHRALLYEWLGRPSKSQYGVARWGLKEVRLTIDHARYLKWLFPNARFLFIYRNLFDAYRSWRGHAFYSSWTNYFSWSPIIFARHWTLLLEGFLQGCHDVDGLVIKYEDLIAGKLPLQQISEHLAISSLDAGVLNVNIGSTSQLHSMPYRISGYDRFFLSAIGGSLLDTLGYRQQQA